MGYVRLTPMGRGWDRVFSHLLENMLCPQDVRDTRPAVCPGIWGSKAALSSLSPVRTKVLT